MVFYKISDDVIPTQNSRLPEKILKKARQNNVIPLIGTVSKKKNRIFW
jgi:hypothetical protein